ARRHGHPAGARNRTATGARSRRGRARGAAAGVPHHGLRQVQVHASAAAEGGAQEADDDSGQRSQDGAEDREGRLRLQAQARAADAMPKMKTKRGAAKRLKRTASGKLRRAGGWKQHKLAKKRPSRRRRLREAKLIDTVDERRLKVLVPYL